MAETLTATRAVFDVEKVRADFPALHQEVYGQPLVYLDNAASAQKPQAVIDRVRRYYEREHSNVHRGVHYLSQQATDAYEGARARIAKYINAPDARQVVYTRGTTDAINLVAATFGRANVRAGDEIVLSTMEHHSNIVPWQMLCEATGARLRIIPIDAHGDIAYGAFLSLLSERTKLVALCHVSNALGTVNPVADVIADAHARGTPVLLDGAQALPHMQVDVQALDVDFYCFSGHKMYGPTGIGCLYAKEEHLEAMPPYQGGGDMIETVSFKGTTFNTLPYKFEAGTPNIAGGVGLGATVDYLRALDMRAAAQHEAEVVNYATERLLDVGNIRLVGTAAEKAGVISFLVGDVHPYDAGTILDRLGIAVRTGHHCTQPLMQHLGLPGTVRASFAFYNTREDADRLVEGVRKVKKMFGA